MRAGSSARRTRRIFGVIFLSYSSVQFLSIILLAYDSHMKRALWVASMQALPVSLILHFLSCTPPSTILCEHSHNLLF